MARKAWGSLIFLFLALFLSSYIQTQAASDITYIYDEAGRLIAVVDPAGDTAIYNYDAVGNLLSISRQSSALVSIIRFTPSSGVVGAPVTIYGTGFSATASQNAVTFNGVAATVTSATATQIITSVPAGATTGLIAITNPIGSNTSSAAFTVTSSSGAPTITGFTPSIGTPSTAMTITGTNFENSTLNNRPTFNIVTSLVSSGTSTSIATTVPAKATSGRISITTPYGKAVSSGDFFVPPAGNLASDVVFTGRMAIGDTRVVNINTSRKLGLMLFDGTAGQQVSLNVTNVTLTAFVTIYNPDGSILIPATSVDNGSFIDTKTLPVTGTYTIFIGPGSPFGSGTGNLTLALYNAPDVVASITPGGVSVTVTTSTPGQNGRLTFNGAAGQRVSLKVSGVTFPRTHNLYIYRPNGNTLYSTTMSTSGHFADAMTLPDAGTYTILYDPYHIDTGSATLTLYDVVDVTGTITPGGSPVPFTITTPGQNARLTFSGAASQRISLAFSSVTVPGSNIYIYKPDGTTLTSYINLGTGGGILDSTLLPVAGTYTILADPSGSGIGNMTMTLYDAPDITGTITPGGSPVALTIGVPGQVARLTFSGTTGQRVSLLTSNVTIPYYRNVSILKPNGTSLASDIYGQYIDVQTLPSTGTYTIVVDPSGSNTGNITINLYDVPADLTGTISAGGPSVPITITAPGQSARLTFSGTAGQRVSLEVTPVTINSSNLFIYKPDGSTLTSVNGLGTGGWFIDTKTLPVTGTYTIFVDPASSYTGSMTLRLFDVPADTTGTITVGGASVMVTTTVPGQNASLTFSGTVSQQVTVRVTGSSMGSVKVTIFKPDGGTLTSFTFNSSSFNLGPHTLLTTGTYTIGFDSTGANTGSLNVSVTSP